MLEEFKELSSAIYDEYERISEVFGLDKFPKKAVKFVERNLKKYTKMYSKPLFLKEKRRVELDIALDTMPHGFFWKIFHSKLWKRMKQFMEMQTEEENIENVESDEKQPVIQVPAVIVEERVVEVPTTSFNDDFELD